MINIHMLYLVYVLPYTLCIYFDRFGPLSKLWCMRFEARHKEFKDLCRRTSFKNLCKTLTEHHQRRLSYNLHCNNLFSKGHIDTGTGQTLHAQCLM